jgi:putative transposase
VRDNDSKFGTQFSRVAVGAGIQELRTPVRVPNANAVAERFLGFVRRECIDHMLVFNLRHLRRVVQDYVTYFDQMRPHQGLQQRIPTLLAAPLVERSSPPQVIVRSVLGGLHHSYEKAA